MGYENAQDDAVHSLRERHWFNVRLDLTGLLSLAFMFKGYLKNLKNYGYRYFPSEES